jgi:GNAT superfamily N-acetyltransferase
MHILLRYKPELMLGKGKLMVIKKYGIVLILLGAMLNSACNAAMHEGMVIRSACTDDIDHIQVLLEQLGYPLQQSETAERVQRYASSENYCIFVVEIEGSLKGFVAGTITESFIVPGKKLHIEALVVDSTCRGQGIGTHLMQFIETWAYEKGCTTIDLVSGMHRASDGTHDFYKKLHFITDEKAYFRKQIR